MRFKSRMFPLIDVMILMLGLFLVILAHAQLTVTPRDEVPSRQRPDTARDGESGVLVLVWDQDIQACYTFDGRVVRSESDLLLEVAEQRLAGRGSEDTAVLVMHGQHGFPPASAERVRAEFERPSAGRFVRFQPVDDNLIVSLIGAIQGDED